MAKTTLRVLAAILVSPIWLPVAAAILVLSIPFVAFLLVGMIFNFALTGEWEFPDVI